MSLTNERFQIQSYPSPLATDVLFYELRDSVLPKNKQPTYGEPHPDPVKWPNHFLVYIQSSPKAADGKQVWWYAAERDSQDLYNWSHAEADIGGNKFDAVAREYVILRSEFNPDSPLQGEAMVDIPAGLFSGTHVLAERSEVKNPNEELASMFVLERRTYVKKVPLVDIEINRETGEARLITTTLYYRGEVVVDATTIEDLVADPDNAYWDLDADGYGRVAKQLSENWFEVTERQWINLKDIWEWSMSRRRPDRYLCPNETVTTTVTTTGNPEGPVADIDLPEVDEGESVTIFKWGEIMKVVTVTETGEPQALNSKDMLSSDGKTYPTYNELVPNNAVPSPPYGIDVTGRVDEYKEIDGCYSAKINRQAISLEDKDTLVRSGLVPEKFIKDGDVSELEETESGPDLGAPSLPAFATGQQVTIDQKGHVRTTKTVIQEGEITPLVGLDLNQSDGYIYPTTDEVVPLADVPASPAQVDENGDAVIYLPYNANFAIKRTIRAVSVENNEKRISDRLAPDKFFRNSGKLSVTVETLPSSGAPPAEVTADAKTRVTLEQKGGLRTVETAAQIEEPEVLNGTSFDERTGEGLIETQELVDHASVVPTEVEADGDLVSYTPINPNFAVKTTKKVASTTVRTWQDIINYEWPPVLLSIDYTVFNKRNGGQLVVPSVNYKEGFAGPQVVTATQYWQKTAPTPIAPVFMIPRGFNYITPFFNLNVPPCLHGDITLTMTIGTEDPVWSPAGYSQTFPATNVVDWPSSITWLESKPYRGGYLVTEWTLPAPST